MRFFIRCLLFSLMIFSSGAYDSSDYSSDSDDDRHGRRYGGDSQEDASDEKYGGDEMGGAGQNSKKAPCCFPCCDKFLLKVCCPCGPRNDFATSFPAKPSNGSAALHATIGLPCLPVVGLFSLAYSAVRAVAVACSGTEISNVDVTTAPNPLEMANPLSRPGSMAAYAAAW